MNGFLQGLIVTREDHEINRCHVQFKVFGRGATISIKSLLIMGGVVFGFNSVKFTRGNFISVSYLKKSYETRFFFVSYSAPKRNREAEIEFML